MKLKEIEDKWTHSRMDYTDSRWLIDRIKLLEIALKTAHENACECCNSKDDVKEHCSKALNGDINEASSNK